MKKALAALGTAIVIVAGIVPLTLPASQGATTGTLTIVSASGAAEGSGWTYTSGTTERIIELSSSSNITASDIESKLSLGDLVLFADEIQINASLSFNTNNLTFRSKGSIRMPGGVTINSGGGDVLFQADSDDSGVGEIRLGTLATNGGSISTEGGDILLSGGSDPNVGFAKPTDLFETSKVPAGVAMYGFTLDADGGNVVIRGSGGASATTQVRGVLLEPEGANRSSISTSNSGEITITGDSSNVPATVPTGDPNKPFVPNRNAWGVTISALDISSESGNVDISGSGNRAVPNARGIVASNMTLVSKTGDINFTDSSDGSSANSYGTYLPGVTITTDGNVVFRADKFNSGGDLDIDATSFVMESYYTNSFQAPTSMGAIDLTGTPTAQLGHPSNTANLIVSGLTSSDGSITLNSSGTITQSAEIVASELNFGSTAAVTLDDTDNDVDVIAADATVGDFIFVDKDDLEIGTVGTSDGIASSGLIQIETLSGDLSVTQPLVALATSADSVILAADNDAAVETDGDGNIKISGSGSVTVDSTSRALLYSGAPTDSTGLVTEVGGESSSRYSVERSTSLSSVSPAIGSTGKFALFRQASQSAPAPAAYSGPIVRTIGDGNSGPYPIEAGETVRVDGERLGSVTSVFIDGIEGTVVSTSDDHFIMVFPAGVSVGTHDLVINSDVGNVTFLDGFIVSTESSSIADANAVCAGAETTWWTRRISDTEAKAYIKCPEAGKKYEILHQAGGSGNYDSVFAKTLADTSDPTQIFNTVGRYIVRTIRLEDVSRIRISVDGTVGWQVRYNQPSS